MNDKMKKTLSLLIIFLLLCPIATSSPAQGQDLFLLLHLKSEDYKILDAGKGYENISMKDFANLQIPGAPRLPVKNLTYALPPGADVTSLEIISQNKEEIAGKYQIAFAQRGIKENDEKFLPAEADKKIYLSNNPFPQENVKIKSSGKMRKWNLINLDFYPMTYFPKSGKLVLIREISVKIHYQIKINLPSQELSDKALDSVAEKLIQNYGEAKNWYEPTGMPGAPAVVYDYIIIVPDSLESAVASFKNAKQSQGFKVYVAKTSWIYANYSGSNNVEQIRNFLKANYVSWGIKYVLIVGSISSVPMLECWPKADDHTATNDNDPVPTDFYYSDLTGDWDSDGDGFYGEYYDAAQWPDGDSGVDFNPEVYVGRIPVDDASTVTAILQKIISFESDGGSWKNNALLLGAISNYSNEDNEPQNLRTDGAVLMELMKVDMLNPKGFSSFTEYEKEGLDPSIYSCNLPLNNTNVLNQWSSVDYGIVNWWAHGSHTSAARKWWLSDTNSDGVPEANEMSWENFISTGDTSALTKKPSLVFACSCLNGYPQGLNLGTELLKQGAAGIICGSVITYYWPGWSGKDYGGNSSLDYYFFNNLINSNLAAGDSLGQAINYYRGHCYNSRNYNWQHQINLEAFNLYGDPAGGADHTPPTGSFSINNGDSNAYSPQVVLTLNATDSAGVNSVMISNSSNFSGASWENYTTSKSWTLTSGLGTKYVYAKFKDGAGNTSNTCSDSIIVSKKCERLFGDNRYLTAISISKKGWSSANNVILARGDLFPDALAGAPLAAKYNAPILLTSPYALNSETADEINRLKANTAYILGSENAISPAVENDLTQKTGVKTIHRLGGENRYETAAIISEQLDSPANKTSFISYGENYPDALSAASIAAYNKMPVLLVGINSVPNSTIEALTKLKINKTIITGQTGVVSQGVEDWFKQNNYSSTRLGGTDRYETCAQIADYSTKKLGMSVNTIGLAYGENFPDALSLGPFCGKNRGPILLTKDTSIPSPINNYISSNKDNIYSAYIAGGPAVVSESVVNQIKTTIEI